MKELLARIKVIQALLEEESQLNILAAIPNANHFKARTRLIQVKVLLKNYSSREIELARNWDRLKEEFYQSACRLSGNLPQETRLKSKANDDFWQVMIFLYLLAKNRPMQAFLSLSIGVSWSVLLLADANEPELPDISESHDTTGTDYHRHLRLHK